MVVECKIIIENDHEVSYERPYSPPVRGTLGTPEQRRLADLTITRLNYWIGSQSKSCQRDDLRALGLHLYGLLFGDARIRKAFEATYRDFKDEFDKEQQSAPNRSSLRRLRVTLVFRENADSLAGYPWEFLFVPIPNINEGFFLTGERAELILTRFVGESKIEKTLQTEKTELRILVVRSQPKELGELDAIADLTPDIEKLGEKNRIAVKTLDRDPRATHDEFKTIVGTFNPHIVHFIGHGKAGKIALIKSAADIELDIANGGRGDEANWVNSDTMRAVFAANPKPSLVFLDACKSAATPETFSIFKSTARQLLHADIPAVVAMQYEISNEDARVFATSFYKNIGEGRSIDEAVKAGRMALGTMDPAWSHPRFGTPVVYLQSEDGVIFSKERVAEVQNTEAAPVKEEASGKQDCPYYDCNARVSPDQKRCGCERRRPLARCPNPECRKAIPKADSDCQFCGCTIGPVTAEAAPYGSAVLPRP